MMGSGDEEELQEEQKHIQMLEDFYQGFAYKLEIYDPLNRPILDSDGNDQATKHGELLKKICEMPAVEGKEMEMPLN